MTRKDYTGPGPGLSLGPASTRWLIAFSFRPGQEITRETLSRAPFLSPSVMQILGLGTKWSH